MKTNKGIGCSYHPALILPLLSNTTFLVLHLTKLDPLGVLDLTCSGVMLLT